MYSGGTRYPADSEKAADAAGEACARKAAKPHTASGSEAAPRAGV
jgi:hypothetical protein